MRVSAAIRTLTNWFGKSALSSLANSARSLTVPVVVSIWLSKVRSFPVASFVFCARSQASTGTGVPDFSRATTCGRLSSGIGKITVIG